MMTKEMVYRRWLIYALALLGFVLICLAQTTNRAAAVEVHCRYTGAMGALLEGADNVRNTARMGLVAFNKRKRNTDLYRLLVSNAHRGMVSDIVLTWQTLMCQARTGDSEAVQLQTRWSESIGRSTDGFRVNRAMDRWLDRLKVSASDDLNLLSPAEKQLLADTVDYLAGSVGEPFDMLADVLREDFDLPQPGPKI